MTTAQIEELFSKLRPIYGNKKMNALWYAYLAEDADGRREIEATLQMMYAKRLGETFDRQQVLLTPPPAGKLSGEYPLGSVLYNKKAVSEFGLREDEWIQHVGIFGRSGAGKTNLVFKIIDNFLAKKKKFMIFDWKKNYRPLISQYKDEEILVFTVGRKVAPLPFNPLIVPPNTEPSTWINRLVEVLSETFFVGEGVKFLLQKAFDTVYKEAGVYEGDPKKWPVMIDVLRFLDTYHARGRELNWMVSTLRTVKSLCTGEFGRALNTSQNASVKDLLEKNVILELDGLGSNEKAFFIETLLLWTHHHRLAEAERETFKHAIIIEEAPHILLKQDNRGHESVVDVVLREERELGTSIILVDQSPSSISLPAIANTYTKICLALGARADVVAAANFLLLDREQKEYLGKLKVGHAIVKLQGRSFQPFLVGIPLSPIKNRFVPDRTVRELMKGYSGCSAAVCLQIPERRAPGAVPRGDKTEQVDTAITEDEKRLLLDILENPFSGVVNRYRRLNTSRRKGTIYKDALFRKGLAKPVEVLTDGGCLLLMELTDKGRDELARMGHKNVRKKGAGKLEHEYFRDKVIKYYEELGFKTAPEKRVKNGHFVDVEARKGGQKIAIEIETGDSDIKHNIESDLAAGFKHVVMVPTNARAERKTQELLAREEHSEKVRIAPARTFKPKARPG